MKLFRIASILLPIIAITFVLTVSFSINSPGKFFIGPESSYHGLVNAAPAKFDTLQKIDLSANLNALNNLNQNEIKNNPADGIDEYRAVYNPVDYKQSETTNNYNRAENNSPGNNNQTKDNQGSGIEQTASTSQGTVKRHIDVSSPWSGAYVYEDMVVEGMAEIRDHFRMDNLRPGSEASPTEDFFDF